MLQSLKQMKSFFQGPIIPNCRTGHWAEHKPQTGLDDPIKQKHAAHTTEKGQGGGIEKGIFRGKHRSSFQKLFYSTIIHPPECQQSQPGHLVAFPLPPSLLQQRGKVGVGKEGALRQKLLQN